MPLIFLLTVILILWIRHAGKQADRQSGESSTEFWQREQDANFTRRADISTLPYIKIPEPLSSLPATAFQMLPAGSPEHEELTSLQEQLHELSEASILNLTGISNTELKLRYGFANLDTLVQCDENFTRLCQTLNRIGRLFKDFQLEQEAIQILSYAVECGSDIQETYLLLAELYQKSGNEEAISELLESVSHFDGLRRSILENALLAYRNPE